jgi:hypothetical protein
MTTGHSVRTTWNADSPGCRIPIGLLQITVSRELATRRASSAPEPPGWSEAPKGLRLGGSPRTGRPGRGRNCGAGRCASCRRPQTTGTRPIGHRRVRTPTSPLTMTPVVFGGECSRSVGMRSSVRSRLTSVSAASCKLRLVLAPATVGCGPIDQPKQRPLRRWSLHTCSWITCATAARSSDGASRGHLDRQQLPGAAADQLARLGADRLCTHSAAAVDQIPNAVTHAATTACASGLTPSAAWAAASELLTVISFRRARRGRLGTPVMQHLSGEAARQAGWHAVEFRSTRQAIAEVEALLD